MDVQDDPFAQEQRTPLSLQIGRCTRNTYSPCRASSIAPFSVSDGILIPFIGAAIVDGLFHKINANFMLQHLTEQTMLSKIADEIPAML